MDARNRHLLSFKAAFFTELLARAVAGGAVPGAYRLIAIHVAECPFETSADKRTHRPGLENRGRRTINEQYRGPWLELGRLVDDIGQDLLLALRVLEVTLMLRQRLGPLRSQPATRSTR
jgi:hypothetical protein